MSLIHLDLLATSVLQHIQVPIESVENAVKENKNSSQTQARDPSLRNQPGQLLPDIRDEDGHEHSSSRQDSARIAGGAEIAALQERSLHKTNETDCQSVKGKAHAECANMNCIFKI